MDTLTGLGKLLRDARLRRGMTEEQVAAALGVQKSEISAFEVGRRKWPQEHIRGLAEVLALSQVEMAVAAGLIDPPATMPPPPLDPDVAALAEVWPALNEARREAILMIAADGVARASTEVLGRAVASG